MASVVKVVFGETREYEFTVSAADLAAMNKDQARAWLANEFEELECTPSNPMGKVLVLDMVLSVAKYAGESRFEQAGAWADKFVQATAVVLERPVVRVDTAAFVVG